MRRGRGSGGGRGRGAAGGGAGGAAGGGAGGAAGGGAGGARDPGVLSHGDASGSGAAPPAVRLARTLCAVGGGVFGGTHWGPRLPLRRVGRRHRRRWEQRRRLPVRFPVGVAAWRPRGPQAGSSTSRAGVHAHSASVSQELGAQGQWPPLDSTGLAGLLLCELLSLAQRLSETAGPAAQEVSPRRGKCGSTESRDEAAWGRRGCSPPAQPPAAPELHRNTHVRPLKGNYSPSSWMLTLDLALGVSPRIGGQQEEAVC
ncbi:fibroin heavy chain-like [Equus przewalskii]|uniref:Fibroin heavy chain-like n=1 Tax=Equus przewalskii TaxID=9798 RepID=A0ABM4MXC9_EQUPR